MMAQVQPLPVGEAETLAARLLREADLSGNADLAIRGIARMLDEALRRIDHLEAELPHSGPAPLQQLERHSELLADRAIVDLR